MPRRPLIVVIGSINTDVILPVARLPLPGETLAGGDAIVVPGGKGANQAVAAARLGARVAMIGRVGNDDFGTRLRLRLAAEDIDTKHVCRTPGATGTAMILLQPTGENSIVLSPGANAKVTPADVDAAMPLIRRADAVLLQLEIPAATVRHALKRCRAAGVRTILDPAPVPTADRASRNPRGPLAWAFDADVLTPNETEARALLALPAEAAAARPAPHGRAAHQKAIHRPDAVAAALIAAGATNVVLKLGNAGSLHADGTGVYAQAAAFTIDVVDTTAAGDTFTAALAVARAEGKPWPDALRFANAAGALACTTLGAQPSLPTRRAVSALLSRKH